MDQVGVICMTMVKCMLSGKIIKYTAGNYGISQFFGIFLTLSHIFFYYIITYILPL
jgi:hypothetical protein